ncbi:MULTISPECIES: selenium metabolism-associated LysR family transcriptional regulator [Bacillus]|uniref:selenium metabolism-associated LysR family transcriptional regulator n=1 Tax=Bacillus TaxID=1386 RepID=UPI000BB78101|nr:MULTISPECIES: selenium metabolism-associated LysR family transcriptional regulator [Bacillus]
MNIEHLKVFYIVAKGNSFSETAKILHLSQPSVSLQIQQLENSLSIKLFERTTKRVTLTPAGKLLYKYAEKILNVIHETKREISLLSESIHGDLNIGASLTIGGYILPYILGRYQKEFPHVNLLLKLDNSDVVIEKLYNQEIHLGFIETYTINREVQQLPFMEDELVIIVSSSLFDSKINKEEITAEELFSLPMIMREKGSGTRQVVEENLRKFHLNPRDLNVILELENTEAIKSAVESGMGVSIISKSAIKKELQLGVLREIYIQDVRMKRHFTLIYKEEALTLPSESFLSFISQYYQIEKLKNESIEEGTPL